MLFFQIQFFKYVLTNNTKNLNFFIKGVDTFNQRRIFNRPTRTDLQTTADGSKREREGRDEERKRY